MTRPEPRDSAAFELRDALRQPGCGVCALTLRSVGRFLESLAYERVNDLDTRAGLRASGGFCNVHAYRWLREAHNVLGTALIYRDVLRAAGEDVAVERDHRRGRLLDVLIGRKGDARSSSVCLACTAQREAEDRYLSALSAIVAEPSGAQLFSASDGVCLVHATVLLRRGGPGADRILTQVRQKIDEIVAALDQVIRKEDYRFRDEPRTDAERTAPPRAVAWAAGGEGLVVLADA